jgi:AraC family transcriptional regulator of arabinose operon
MERFMLYVTAGALEHCAPDKHKIRVICPSVWIHYVIGGFGYYNGEKLCAGEAFIVHKDDLCEYYPDKNDPWSYIWIRIGGTDSEDLMRRCGIPEKSGIFKFDYAERLTKIVSNTISETFLSAANMPYKEALAKMILSLNVNDTGREERRDAEWVVRAKEYMAENYHKRLAVEDIARALYVDRKYLRNLFVKYTGKSTKSYLDNLRMERAAVLLASSELSVGIISSSVGYGDQLSFSKAFKKHFGVSPTVYRKNAELAAVASVSV